MTHTVYQDKVTEMATIVYRVQPQGADLHGIDTETSNGDSAGGVHVFESLAEVYNGCLEWMTIAKVELVTIECQKADLKVNGDYEGVTLRKGRGTITQRKKFKDSRAVAQWAKENA